MKFNLYILFSIGLVLLTSCTREEADPVIEIYVTTEASEKWTDADVNVGNIRFVSGSDSSSGTFSSLQSFFGTEYSVELNEPETKIIFNNSHFDYDKLLGFRLLSTSFQLGNADSELRRVSVPNHEFIELEEPVAIENGKQYRFDIMLDLDELVSDVNGALIFDPNYTISVKEL